MNRPPELAFLDELLNVESAKFERAEWLRRPFRSNSWYCSFGTSGSFTLDFDILLPSGVPLIQHPDLLRLFKLWLTNSTRCSPGELGLSQAHAYALVHATIGWIDYLLLHAEEFRIADFELRLITPDALRGIFYSLTSSQYRQEAVYEWSRRLGEFLVDALSKADVDGLDKVIMAHPELAVIEDEQIDSSDLPIPLADIPRVRAWLLINGHFKTDCRLGYRYAFKSRVIAQQLLNNTLRGVSGAKTTPLLLCAGPYRPSLREFPMMPTSSKGERGQRRSGSAATFRSAAKALIHLHDADVSDALPPGVTLKAIDTLEAPSRDGRFKTLPLEVVFTSIRAAIELHLTIGPALVKSYLRLVQTAKRNECEVDELPKRIFLASLEPEIRALGVQSWSIDRRERSGGIFQRRGDDNEYFIKIRSNHGLFELLEVYYGAVETVVGALMARRQIELIAIKAGSALDISKSYLLFSLAKSSRRKRGVRQREARPIIRIGAEMIESIQRLQAGLIKSGALAQWTSLFSPMARQNPSSLTQLSANTYNASIDAFCDYIETPLKDGRRYYLRQHLLRRFFAMLFFWGHAFGGLETLRWFLGHADLEYIYRYVTEITPGSILRGVKAQFAATHLDSYGELAALIAERFGTHDFSLLDEDELEAHIEGLIEEGTVAVEPKFFTGPQGEDYEVVVIVRRMMS